MTDKSFGDHTIRNTLKNPLLSSAVTGLSLDDLTHNAVLLPVSLSQEAITRAEPATQSVTLRHPDNVITNYPSGDANANPLPPNLPTIPSATPMYLLPTSKPECETDNSNQTLSKASAKTDDDFDVNEYFARLQGSRYVSAPLNSALKEDSNANLEATEENLEEINLNEPEKVEQSITADIAQNFSQLPTVLPQMASAVFSSFSNMLQTRRSREPTPEARSSGYQDLQFERPKETISEILPPKEPPTLPPTVGTTSYRLSTKKKYAQIPGLSSGDNAQFSFQSNQITQPINQNIPQYFVPNIDNNKNETSSSLNKNLSQIPTEVNKYVTSAYAASATIAGDDVGASHFDIHVAPPTLETTGMSQGQPAKKDILETVDHKRPAGQNVPPYYVPPLSNTGQKREIETEYSVDYLRNESSEVSNMLNVLQNIPIELTSGQISSASHKEEASKNILQFVPEVSTSLPPPPMFANAPNVKTDVQKSVNRSVLPPSIARRIGANQPIIKQIHAPAFTENFFVPTAVDNSNNQSLSGIPGIVQPSTDLTSNSGSASVYPLPPQAFTNSPSTTKSQPSLPIVSGLEPIRAPPKSPPGTTIAPPPVFSPFVSPQVTQSTFEQDSTLPEKAASQRPPTIFTNAATVIQEPTKEKVTGTPPNFPPNVALPSSTFSSKEPDNLKSRYPPSFATNLPPTTLTSNVPIPTAEKSLLSSTNISFPMPQMNISSQPPAALFTPSSLSTAQQNIPSLFPLGNPPTAPTVPAVSMFTPNVETQSSILNVTQTLSETAPPRVSEPPKAVGSTNFRMTKRRPQYYAGPIEGVGAISNNVKPIITPVDTAAFQGALFTPTIDITQQAAALETMPFDINRPVPLAELKAHPFNVKVSSTYPTPEATQYSDYNTAFDMSRRTTESFNQAKEDSSGFGLFGSLKSKLSSIDINKIQSTVTTFFDPTYNDNKKDVMGVQESTPYLHQQYANLDQAQGNNFNIFVPQAGQAAQVEQGTEAYAQYYNYETPYQYSYSQQSQPYQNQETHTSLQNTGNMESYNSNPSILNYQSSTYVNQPLVFNVNPDTISDSATGKHVDVIHSQEIKAELPSHAINTEPAYPIILSQETNQIQPIQSLNENIPSKQKHDEQMRNTKEENISILQSASASCFDSPGVDTIPFGSSIKVNEAFTHNVRSGVIAKSLLFDNQEITNLDLEFSSSKRSYPPNVNAEGGITASFRENQAESKNDGCISTFKEVTTENINKNVNLMDSQNISPEIKSLTQEIDSETSNYKLFTNSPADFFGLFNNDSNTTSIFSNFTLSDDRSFAMPQSKTIEKDDEYIRDAPQLDASSAPLFGLSSMLADKTKELSDLQDEMRKMSIEQPKEVDTIFNRGTNISFFENLEVIGTEKNVDIAKDEVPDLNICETCREVSKLDDREKDDLTTQLIENITSPIQLSNPVEVPLTESNTPVDERDDFSSEQCAEISHITEETIEAIQVKSATELLDDPIINLRKYGWSEEPYSKNIDVAYSSFQTNQDNDYSLNINPNTVGFFGGTSLYENMGSNKDLQKNFFGQDDVPNILPRQMSVPTAPPEEDDSKSESIDVLSIEQDAKKDFPIFEEFVIEPDDFKKSTDSIHQLDSFTSRVDKYKKKEEEVTDKIEKTSPSLPIASYFDTGNYAVETHYKNSLSSPNAIRAPQGFEDHYQVLPSNTDVEKNDIPFIPETSTQTRPIYSPTFTTAQTNSSIVTSSKLVSLSSEIKATVKLPDCNTVKNISGPPERTHKVDLALRSIQSITEETTPNFDLLQAHIIRDPTQSSLSAKVPDFDSILGTKTDDNKEAMELQKPVAAASVELKPLPDPINFFSTHVETVEKTTTDDQGFNRLASYFASPAKTDHTKSFFELSQSQNHYRQDSNISAHSSNETNKASVPVAQSSDNNSEANIHNIPQEQYLANLSLMRDLTSCQNADFKPEQIVRTVNYFTIEYDNETLIKNLNKGEPDLKTTLDNSDYKEFKIDETNIFIDDKAFIKIIQKCPHCCNFNRDLVKDLDNISNDFNKFDVKTCMDSKSDSKKDSNNVSAMEGGGSQFESRQSVTVNFEGHSLQEDRNESVAVADEYVRAGLPTSYDNAMRCMAADRKSCADGGSNRSSTEYTPVKHHWFYRVDVEGKSLWRGFSTVDSKALEDAFHSPNLNENTLVATDGGRYDVNVSGRLRFPVYWNDKPSNVLRCSWFYKGTTEARYVPYPEAVAEKLEEEYRHGMTTGEWHRRLVLPNNELVVLHGPAVMVHFLQGGASDAFSTPPLFAFGKRVYRNPPKIRVARDQPAKIDHLVMMVHGAGEYRHQQEKIQSTMRPVRRGCDESEIEEVEPSSIDHLLLLCHGVGSACDMKFRAVEEVVDDFRATSLQLIQSHYRHSYESGVVGRVEVLPISWHSTLHSGETGVDKRLARITLDSIPRLRNFTNDTVLDVLFYTSPVFCQTIINTVCAEINRIYKLFRDRNPSFTGGVSLGGHSLGSVILYDLLGHQNVSGSELPYDKRYVSGAAGTGQPSVKYPQLSFSPVALYALGSPIAIFECIRGVDCLGPDFALPTCKNFFNIFHPYDPIAYRIEPLIDPQLRDVKPYLIPHHKGRKRMHLELKDTMARVGADIKQKLMESIRNTWTSMWKTQQPPTDQQLEKVVEEELEKEHLTNDNKEESIVIEEATPKMLGKLNDGRRVDFVLQETPLEMINEYIFAMRSHVCYWESEDTMLLMLREIYSGLGVPPDCSVPQRNLTVQRTKLVTHNEDETITVSNEDYPSTSRGAT